MSRRSATTGFRASMRTPGRMPATKQSTASISIAEVEKRSTSWAFSAAGSRGRPRNVSAERPNEARRCKRRRKRQQGTDRGDHQLQSPLIDCWTEQNRLKHQPFRDEPVERWKSGNCQRAPQTGQGRKGHSMNEASKPLEISNAGGVQNGAGAEEQQAFEERVIQDMQ